MTYVNKQIKYSQICFRVKQFFFPFFCFFLVVLINIYHMYQQRKARRRRRIKNKKLTNNRCADKWQTAVSSLRCRAGWKHTKIYDRKSRSTFNCELAKGTENLWILKHFENTNQTGVLHVERNWWWLWKQSA